MELSLAVCLSVNLSDFSILCMACEAFSGLWMFVFLLHFAPPGRRDLNKLCVCVPPADKVRQLQERLDSERRSSSHFGYRGQHQEAHSRDSHSRDSHSREFSHGSSSLRDTHGSHRDLHKTNSGGHPPSSPSGKQRGNIMGNCLQFLHIRCCHRNSGFMREIEMKGLECFQNLLW